MSLRKKGSDSLVSDMRLIAGLGNPGQKYRENRHNLGFMVVDSFARARGISWRFSQDWSCYFAKSEEFLLVKPSVFMNRSGEAIKKAADYFKVESHDILIVYDDVDLPFGKIRLAFNGLSAGHHGIDSVIECFGVEFGRLRVGVGHPRQLSKDKVRDVADYVLENFGESEQKELGHIIDNCNEAIGAYLDEGINATMNRFN